MESLNRSTPIHSSVFASLRLLKNHRRRQAHQRVHRNGLRLQALRANKPCLSTPVWRAWVSFLADYHHYIGNDRVDDLIHMNPTPLDMA